MELVITRGNDDPWHQDVKTAAEVYIMNGCGLRVMFDLGAKADRTSNRVFKIHNGKNDGLEWDFKDHIIIGMNGAAAGSQRKTKFHHARFGDGITLMVDMVPTQKKGGRGGLGNKAPNAAQLKVNVFFRNGAGLRVRYPN